MKADTTPTNPSQEEEEEETNLLADEEREAAKSYDKPTPDSYDPNIIPAETAARKEREGDDFKRLPQHPPGSESLDTTGGFTVDKEGLVDNFAVEPEMYYETPGDAETQSDRD